MNPVTGTGEPAKASHQPEASVAESPVTAARSVHSEHRAVRLNPEIDRIVEVPGVLGSGDDAERAIG